MNIRGDRDAGRLARRRRVGRRRREAGELRHHQERRRSSTIRPRASRRRGSTGGTKRRGKPTRSHGCSYAQSWADVQFQRMPNVSLLPGREGSQVGRPHRRRPIAASRSSATARSPSTSSATTRSSAARCSMRSRAARSSACSRTSRIRCARPSSGARMDMIGGKKQLLPRRRVRRREGSAGAGQRRELTAARRRASATSTSSTPAGTGRGSTKVREVRKYETAGLHAENAEDLLAGIAHAGGWWTRRTAPPRGVHRTSVLSCFRTSDPSGTYFRAPV